MNGVGGSSPQLLEHDANNADTLVADVRDVASANQPGNSVSLDAASAGNSPLSASAFAPRRRERKSVTVRPLQSVVFCIVILSYFRTTSYAASCQRSNITICCVIIIMVAMMIF